MSAHKKHKPNLFIETDQQNINLVEIQKTQSAKNSNDHKKFNFLEMRNRQSLKVSKQDKIN